jgi:hypothetical protein
MLRRLHLLSKEQLVHSLQPWLFFTHLPKQIVL